jgi:hypothetical protein
VHFCPENAALRFEIVGAVGGADEGAGVGCGAGAGSGAGAGAGCGTGDGVGDGAAGVVLLSMLPHPAARSDAMRASRNTRALNLRSEIMFAVHVQCVPGEEGARSLPRYDRT